MQYGELIVVPGLKSIFINFKDTYEKEILTFFTYSRRFTCD